MYSDWVLSLLFGVVFVWLLSLSYFLWRQTKFLEDLFPRSGERDIRKKFEEVLNLVKNFKGDLAVLEGKIKEIEKGDLAHIQKIELLRYNPYDETGGNISFSVALLDDKGDGVVITSLHSRAGTRIFAKPVIKGKPENYEFSKEESGVIKKALNKQ